jgi:hypothetical protein
LTPDFFTADDRIAWFRGDGSERCLVCHVRDPGASYYVGQRARMTHEGLPERFPVCGEEHGLMWMVTVWTLAFEPAFSRGAA